MVSFGAVPHIKYLFCFTDVTADSQSACILLSQLLLVCDGTDVDKSVIAYTKWAM